MGRVGASTPPTLLADRAWGGWVDNIHGSTIVTNYLYAEKVKVRTLLNFIICSGIIA